MSNYSQFLGGKPTIATATNQSLGADLDTGTLFQPSSGKVRHVTVGAKQGGGGGTTIIEHIDGTNADVIFSLVTSATGTVTAVCGNSAYLRVRNTGGSTAKYWYTYVEWSA